MSMTGMPASIIFLTGSVSVPMPNAWIATKSHFCEAMLSIAARCLVADSSPSNQVTSTLNSLPQNSAACLPCAHQVACRPALEKAAFSGFSDRPMSAAMAALSIESMPNPPNSAAAAALEPAAFLIIDRRVAGDIGSPMVMFCLPAGCRSFAVIGRGPLWNAWAGLAIPCAGASARVDTGADLDHHRIGRADVEATPFAAGGTSQLAGNSVSGGSSLCLRINCSSASALRPAASRRCRACLPPYPGQRQCFRRDHPSGARARQCAD